MRERELGVMPNSASIFSINSIARLAMPRLLIRGDAATLSVIAHNFLAGRLAFKAIPTVIERTMAAHAPGPVRSLPVRRWAA